jgi:hypothetical protein
MSHYNDKLPSMETLKKKKSIEMNYDFRAVKASLIGITD